MESSCKQSLSRDDVGFLGNELGLYAAVASRKGVSAGHWRKCSSKIKAILWSLIAIVTLLNVVMSTILLSQRFTKVDVPRFKESVHATLKPSVLTSSRIHTDKSRAGNRSTTVVSLVFGSFQLGSWSLEAAGLPLNAVNRAADHAGSVMKTSRDGFSIVIGQYGLYHLTAQVTYTTPEAYLQAAVTVNGRRFVRCIGTTGPEATGSSPWAGGSVCQMSAVRKLKSGDRIGLQHLKGLAVDVDPAATYISISSLMV